MHRESGRRAASPYIKTECRHRMAYVWKREGEGRRERVDGVWESLRTWEETGTVWRGHWWKCWWQQDAAFLFCVCEIEREGTVRCVCVRQQSVFLRQCESPPPPVSQIADGPFVSVTSAAEHSDHYALLRESEDRGRDFSKDRVCEILWKTREGGKTKGTREN